MDITLIAIALFILLAIVFLLLFLVRSTSKKTFKSDDGSVFNNQEDLDLYQKLYEKTKPLFSLDDQQNPNQPVLGFDTIFLNKITKEGFSDLKTLLKYRRQLNSLIDLINK